MLADALDLVKTSSVDPLWTCAANGHSRPRALLACSPPYLALSLYSTNHPLMEAPLSPRTHKSFDDTASLTSFNPFNDEDENDQSGYALVTSLLSKVKNTFAPPLSFTSPAPPPSTSNVIAIDFAKRASGTSAPVTNGAGSRDRPTGLSRAPSRPAPPVISLTPVVSESPSYIPEPEVSRPYIPQPHRNSPTDAEISYGTTIPGFPIPDDVRSVRTMGSLKRTESVSKVVRRLRGEGMFCVNSATTLLSPYVFFFRPFA